MTTKVLKTTLFLIKSIYCLYTVPYKALVRYPKKSKKWHAKIHVFFLHTKKHEKNQEIDFPRPPGEGRWHEHLVPGALVFFRFLRSDVVKRVAGARF